MELVKAESGAHDLFVLLFVCLCFCSCFCSCNPGELIVYLSKGGVDAVPGSSADV